MLAQTDPESPLDDMEEAIEFSRAAVLADLKNAADLIDHLNDWDEGLPELRAQQKAVRFGRIRRDARRQVANEYVDHYSIQFGDHLKLKVNKDLTSTEWKRFFGDTPSRFIKRPLGEQVATIRGWLTTNHPTLEPYKAELTFWTDKADEVLQDDATSRQATADFHQARAAFAKRLTAKRDALYRLLCERAEERGLGRDWPLAFFR